MARLSVRVLVAVVVAFTLAFHAGALGGWWLNDDPQVLLHAKRYSPAEVAFDSAAWGTLSTANYTPLVTMSFDVDLSLFGMNAGAFYAHQLIALVICFALFAILLFRLTASWWGSLLATLTVIASPAAVLMARQLMLRHYVEGAVLAIAALLVWLRTRQSGPAPEVEREDARFLWLSALLYFVAMLAKEIYAPLPLLFLALEFRAKTSMRRLVAKLLPSAVAAIAYLLLRRRLLGSGGGYGSIAPETSLDLPRDVLGTIFSNASAVPFAMLLIAIITVLFLLKGGWQSLRSATLMFVFAMLPLVAVAGSIEARYGWIPVLCLASLLAVVWTRSLVAKVLASLLALFVLAGGIEQRRALLASEREMVAEGKYIWFGREGDPVLLADSPGWYLAGLRDLRKMDRGSVAPRFVLSEEAFLLGVADPEKSVDVVGGSLLAVDATRGGSVAVRGLRDGTLPIDLVIRRREATLSWSIGPECDCDYKLVTLPEYETFPLPRNGSRRVPRPSEQQFVRLLRVERSGRWNVTPPLALPAEGMSASTRAATE